MCPSRFSYFRTPELGLTDQKYWPCRSNSVRLGSSPRAPTRVGGLRAVGRGSGNRASHDSLLLSEWRRPASSTAQSSPRCRPSPRCRLSGETTWPEVGGGRSANQQPSRRSRPVICPDRLLARERLGFAQPRKALERLGLELAHTLARHPEPPSDLVERRRLGAVEAVAEDDHASLTLAQDRECVRQRFVAKRLVDPLLRQRTRAGDQIAENGVPLIAHWLVETRRGPGGRLYLKRLLEREACPLRELRERRLAPELNPQRPLGPVQLLHPLDDVHGHPDRAGRVGEPARDRLRDPPGRVRRELEAFAPVELLDCTHQPERPLLDQIEKGEALVAVPLRDRDDQAQVRLDHRLPRVEFAPFDPLHQLDLLGGGQERSTACVAQEELECVGRRLLQDRLRRRILLVLDHLDPVLLELAADSVQLKRIELARIEDFLQRPSVKRARHLGSLEQLLPLLARERMRRCSGADRIVRQGKLLFLSTGVGRNE